MHLPVGLLIPASRSFYGLLAGRYRDLRTYINMSPIGLLGSSTHNIYNSSTLQYFEGLDERTTFDPYHHIHGNSCACT